jgi:histidine triad (HIT) family protein
VLCHYEGLHAVLGRVNGMVVLEPTNPVTEGHVLVVPERHVESALTDEVLTGEVFRAAARWAAECGYTDVNLITNAGRSATQEVFHLHVHVVPRREGDGLALPWHIPGRAGDD